MFASAVQLCVLGCGSQIKPHDRSTSPLGAVWENRKPGVATVVVERADQGLTGILAVEAVVDASTQKVFGGTAQQFDELADGEHLLLARVTYTLPGSTTAVHVASHFHFSTEKECRTELHVSVTTTSAGAPTPQFSEKLSCETPWAVMLTIPTPRDLPTPEGLDEAGAIRTWIGACVELASDAKRYVQLALDGARSHKDIMLLVALKEKKDRLDVLVDLLGEKEVPATEGDLDALHKSLTVARAMCASVRQVQLEARTSVAYD